jgi:hypothetical protein
MIKNIFINIKKYLTYKTKSGKLNLPIDGSKKTKSKNARTKKCSLPNNKAKSPSQ